MSVFFFFLLLLLCYYWSPLLINHPAERAGWCFTHQLWCSCCQPCEVFTCSYLLLSYQGNSEEVGCYMAGYPLSQGNRYFELRCCKSALFLYVWLHFEQFDEPTGAAGYSQYNGLTGTPMCAHDFFRAGAFIHWNLVALNFLNFILKSAQPPTVKRCKTAASNMLQRNEAQGGWGLD